MEQLTWETVKKAFDREAFLSLNFSEIMEGVAAGESYKDILAIPDSIMEQFSLIAEELLDNELYQDASDCFFVLATLNPKDSEYWLRLGNAEHSLEHFDEGLHAYSMAMWTNSDDPFPHIYSAQIYEKQKENEKAIQCIEVALQLLEDAPEFQAVLPKLHAMKENIQRGQVS